ncbi:MAG: glycosyl hydrolase, partial [Bacteroidota bacterium]
MMKKRSWLVLAVLIPALNISVAQVKNIRLDEQGTDNPYICEPSIAINPRDPKNIVAASVLNNIYYTKDGGLTWQKHKMTSSFGVYGDPA